MPFNCTVGAEEHHVDHPPAPSPVSPPSAVLGNPHLPTFRRFFTRVMSFNPTSITRVYTGDPTTTANVVAFTQFASVARFELLRYHVKPCSASRHFMMEVDCAWFPNCDNPPTRTDDLQRCPMREVHLLGPAFPGGRVDPVSFDCPASYGISHIFKPSPVVGGEPRFSFHYRIERVGGEVEQRSVTAGKSTSVVDDDSAVVAYYLYLEAVVNLSLV
uniref:Uncharacterized protein n=1 Tax=Ishige okamurae associated tymo-like virus TaxID=2933172 RepID=A0A9C7GWH2_9VIRU|nr:hypothetical protein [Ishige okamurae associated tymo-like virus]CAI5383845.1 hypothetical protein [Ishige okamurae associated tymo-like virus]